MISNTVREIPQRCPPWSSTTILSKEYARTRHRSSRFTSGSSKFSLEQLVHQLKSRTSLDPFQYVELLAECAEKKSASSGKAIHGHIVSSGCEVTRYLKNHLIFMYAKCGCLQQAVELFTSLSNPNVFSWTAAITAYAREGDLQGVLRLYRTMQLQGTKPDAFVFSTVLAACSCAEALEQGKSIHHCVVTAGMESGVVGNAIINLYGKCGNAGEAEAVFLRLPEKTLVSWNALIAANAQNGHCKEALHAFYLMDLDGSVRPNDATFVSVLDAVSITLDLPRGRLVHERILHTGYETYLFVGNSLVNMYGKCGSLDSAKLVFDEMQCRDALTWTCLVAAYALNGHRIGALEWYQRMDLEGIPSNDITFVSMLFACGHSGLVYEGRDFFISMVEDHFISPTKEHYNCMIDLLARAGWLEYAKQLIHFSPYGHKSFDWLLI